MAMAAPASTRPYAESVTITLTSIRRTQDATRHIVLHPDEPVVIGRSSRSEFKNLSSSIDNALFDCPVVSRKHAEFELRLNKWDVDKHQIYITDTGSMHGTSVNSQKLQPTKRFHLRVGDVIRLGDSVNQGQNSYDGVMVTLDCISVASQKESTQVTSGPRGISCPSDPESDSDDDIVEEVEAEAPSSAQTTPDQPAEKPVMKRLARFGSSILTGIVLDDDNEPESVAAAPVITARSIVVPDTYDEDSYDAPHNAPDVERTLQFDDGHFEFGGAANDGQQEIDEEDAVYGAEESEIHFSDDAQSQESNDDNTSDAASSHHSFSSEPNSMSDFQDDEDEHEWAEQNDMYSIHDDQDEEEGPEVMSSKRTQSVEIGTLGNAPDHEYQPSDMPPQEPVAPTRSHYDPVRGMFQVAAAPFTDSVRTARSSKWDVGPTSLTSNSGLIPQVEDCSFGEMISGALGRSTHGEQIYPTLPAWGFSRYQPVHTDFGRDDDQDRLVMPAVCDGSKKRKASEISTGFVPLATAPEFQLPRADDTLPKSIESAFSEAEPQQHQTQTDNPVISIATDEPITAEPQAKKLKTDQPRSKKSMLRTAALEASKYTAGAIIGGIGLVTILASPIGEALASC